MKTGALIIAVTLASFSAAPAFACTIDFDLADVPRTDLSEDEMRAFIERKIYHEDLAHQRASWRNADYVFLAQIRSLQLVGENRAISHLKPIVSLKGNVGSSSLKDQYAPDFGSSCGRTLYPGFGETAIIYGRRLPWWRRLLNWGQPEVIEALPLRMVLDRQIPTELRAAATRLRKTETK
ncbi:MULTISPECIES: hypothetical protein [unclassified Brevundimonas]|uniref:hypothetical protein n=1 Tax=unclassified Brevundimonas TaxID=2622653 RepID=UPI000CFB6C37|nr:MULTISPECIES: hypothetical protein [unclassified Brevundimonas]PRA35257.1 hypothetical protein CQ024_02240 [Brevundimonas sp. MYb27]PQZ82994.1 hypothetical protein CQ026_07095 [Brevundimonas sp. MYb31]PRB14980.1 hypothetical protein CQ039_08880 [Brevundimonas sp. MYb52]PRB36917.1 hypothetical protein CQ035_04535 [Brevundimonas sp. MYb46]PRB52222.1 hypothetical protein CQ028_06645 [Brevundimonas sp. MYb33]